MNGALFFFSLKKKEPKNSRRKNSFTQGRLPLPHFLFSNRFLIHRIKQRRILARSFLLMVFLPILDFAKKDTP
jgi:hypothetical protein